MNKHTELKEFVDISDAFDYCREYNRPVKVRITGNDEPGVYRLYPSGKAEVIAVQEV